VIERHGADGDQRRAGGGRGGGDVGPFELVGAAVLADEDRFHDRDCMAGRSQAHALLRGSGMARRITAVLAIIVIIGVLLMLAWTVERHRERARVADEPADVALLHRDA
jgi:hypothetical protein